MLNKDLRKRIVEIVTKAKEGHIPSSFSIVDIIDHLYGQVLRFDAADPNWSERDIFVLSKGHGCAGLYVVLEKYKLLSSADLDNYSQPRGVLGGHPDRTKVPFIEASTGSLGHGFPFSVGIAIGNKIKQKKSRVIALLGDGECHEGTIWEAAHVAANRGLDNLVAIVDWNLSGAQLCPVDDLPAKWASFGWEVHVFDGHNQNSISDAFKRIEQASKPIALIGKNTKGYGVKLVEGHGRWHHRIPNQQEFEQIMEALEV
ncbi:transketolase [Aliiglaciecola sp. LCG003]|uniref:transketolase n=1 Tax=Aliiglaciecola sp. LCG003 TaxID=3053655 RepID=UPI00257221D2|nr:transketolase [Aliiglaciecola sp. LCG003]WJG10592.1 transketolase [Aliiglaciecola sp. LCG003]